MISRYFNNRRGMIQSDMLMSVTSAMFGGSDSIYANVCNECYVWGQ